MAVETEGGAYGGYAPPPEQPPLGSYGAATALFNAAFAGAIAAAAHTGRLPERGSGRPIASTLPKHCARGATA